jgi:hypothetical protein
MANIFINQTTGMLASAGSFGPYQTNMMKRVFYKACGDLRIPDTDTVHRDALASAILAAARENAEESRVFNDAMVTMKSCYF